MLNKNETELNKDPKVRMLSFDKVEINRNSHPSLMLGEMIYIGNALGIVSGFDLERISIQLVGSLEDFRSLPVKPEHIEEIREISSSELNRITACGFSYFRYLTRYEGLPDILASHCHFIFRQCDKPTGKSAAKAAIGILSRQQGQSALESFAYSINSLYEGHDE